MDVLLMAAMRMLPHATGQEELAQLAWVVMRTKALHEPPPGLIPLLLQSSLPLLPSMSFTSLTVLLASVARLGAQLPPGWVAQAAEATARASGSRQARRLPLRQRTLMADRVLYALEEMGHVPAGDEGRRLWEQQLAVYNPKPLSQQQMSGSGAIRGYDDGMELPVLRMELERAAGSGLSLPPAVWQNLSAAVWGLICYIEWKGGL